jgi:O-antigen/teichoic acid export membrane protein
LLFSGFKAHVAYVGAVALTITIYEQTLNFRYKNKFLPDLKIKKSDFQFSKVKELFFSGIWNTISRLGAMLQDGLDLLIANLMISPNEMGILALARTFPDLINSVLSRIATLFMPNLTDLYAKGKKDEFVYELKKAMKIISMAVNIPIAIFVCYGDILFSLWIPTANARLLQLLSTLAILPSAIVAQAAMLHSVFVIINKVKLDALLICFTGLLNIIIVFILLKITNWGLFAVAGVSSMLSMARNICYTIPFGAIYIECKWYTFFPEFIKSVATILAVSIFGISVKSWIPVHSWLWLFGFSLLVIVVGFVFNFFILFSKIERRNIIYFLKRFH